MRCGSVALDGCEPPCGAIVMSSELIEIVMQVTLAGSLLVVLYAYAGYPVVLWVWSLCVRRPVCRIAITPSVSIVIPGNTLSAYFQGA